MNYEVIIPNWTKFNPRQDRSNYAWFRFQNDFLHDQKIFPLSEKEKLTYMFLLCEASKKNTGEITISVVYASAILRFKESEVIDCIKVLNSCGVVTAISQPNDGKAPSNGIATIRYDTIRTDIHVDSKSTNIGIFWNENCSPLRKIRTPQNLSDKRLRRAKELHKNFTDDEIKTAIKKMAASSFCQGKKSKEGQHSGWQADFDFLLQPGRLEQALEGKFDDKSQVQNIIFKTEQQVANG